MGQRNSIYFYLTRYLHSLGRLDGKVVVDIPAGHGQVSSPLQQQGAIIKALDIYPEKIQGEGIEKIYADMNHRLPLADNSVDYILCLEGIEHIHNQYGLLVELNRILKPGGSLILTTPSLSHIRARLSILLVESEYWKRMPASEVDSVWFSETESSRIYFGHIYLINASHLRTLTALSGFSIQRRLWTNLSTSSMVLAVLFYPLIVFTSFIALFDSWRKQRYSLNADKRRIYWEQLCINISPVTLFCKDIFWVLTKQRSIHETIDYLREMQRR